MIITVKKKHWWDKLLDLIFDTKEIYDFIANDENHFISEDNYQVKFSYNFTNKEYHGGLYINNKCKYNAGNTFFDFYRIEDVQSYKDVPTKIINSYINKKRILQDKQNTINKEIKNMLKECEVIKS